MKTILKNLIIVNLLFFVIFLFFSPSILMAQMPIDDCGVFVEGVEAGCILFDSDHYGEYLFFGLVDPFNIYDPLGPYEFGDRIRVIGMVDMGCISFCMQGEGCLYDCIVTGCEGDFTCGDYNEDGYINILDVVYLIKYIYKSGPPPIPPQSANVNYGIEQNSAINIVDIVYLINFKYKGGPSLLCP